MGRKRTLPSGMTTRDGRNGYFANFTVGGRRCRDFLSTDFKAACQILNDLKAKADKGDFGLLDNAVALDDIRKKYLAHCRQSLDHSTVKCYERWLDTILPDLAVHKASQLSVPGVVGYRQKRLAAGLSPRTVNGEVGALSTMLSWAVDPGRLIGNNPLAGLKPLPHLRPKEGRAMTDDEVDKLLKASPAHWRDVWFAFLVTGLRKSELAALQFTPEFIDWEGRELIVPAWLAKSGVQRRIPMNDDFYAMLRRLEASRQDRKPGGRRGHIEAARITKHFTRDHIFTTTQNTPLTHRGNLWRAFVGCLKKAGIERQTFDRDGRVTDHLDLHSLRRTFATSLIVGGADPKSVQELLGHKTLALTMKVYAKVRSQTKRQAIAKLTYGTQATGPEHILQLPIPGAKSHQSVTTRENDSQSIAE